MNFKKVFIAIAVASVTLASMPAYGQEAQSTCMTLEDAVNITLDSNETLKAIGYEKESAKRERQSAIGLFMPRANLKGAYIYMQKDIDVPFNNLKPGAESVAKGIISDISQSQILGPIIQPYLPAIQAGMTSLFSANWNYTIQDQSFGFLMADVEMPIFMGGKIIVANKAAKLKEKEVWAQADQKINSLYSEIVERYYGYQLALQVVSVREQVLAGMEKHLKDIKALEKNGMVANTECMYVQYKYAEAERELMNARMQVETVRSALSSTLGVAEPSVPVTAMFIVDNLESLQYFQDMASGHNPLIEQVDLKQQLAKQNVNLHRADFMPQIVGMAGGSFYTYQVTNVLPRWAVGVGFNFKIFDGLTREYKYSAAKNTLRRVESIKIKADRDIQVLIESLYNRMVSFKNQIVSIESSMSFAEEYLRAKNSAFTAGMCSSTDIVDAELNLAKVRIERMQAAFNFDVALAKLLESSGLSTEFIEYSRRLDSRAISFN